MKKHKLAPDKIGRKYSKWMHLALASLIGASLAMSLEVPPSAAAPVVKPGKPLIKVRGKPTTKAAKKAALGAAATSLLLDPVVNLAAGPTDQSKIPHYFGPYPNWALSPLRTADAKVSIADCTGCPGTGATATATVDPQTEAVTAIAIVNPGSGYTTPTITIQGSGTGAAATATVSSTNVVTSISVTATGHGYKRPTVSITGGGATTAATATAWGGVDAVTLGNPGSGYTFPTVDFDMPDDPNGVQAKAHATFDTNGAITAIVVDDPGAGYLTPPNVVIRDGTLMDPINNGGSGATGTATLQVVSVVLDTYGAGYTSAPTVTIIDGGTNPTGSGAFATAFVDAGAIKAITVDTGGSGYIAGKGIRKFVDELPVLCTPPACPKYTVNPAAKYIPLAVPEVKQYPDLKNPGVNIAADEYQIALVQYRTSFSTSLPPTLVRGYVQLETPANAGISQHYPLTNANVDPLQPDSPVLINNAQVYGVTPPQWLGPTIAATKNKPVRIVFRNLLPTGAKGDLFLPVDSTLMGSGDGPQASTAPLSSDSVMDEVRNPACTEVSKSDQCFKDNRATLHLHGGISPWISDGTPHQWITPANQSTPWPQGVSVGNVPDMSAAGCNGTRDGCQTFYYTNQQSARLMFYHDHAWGITRLNVYAGEAAGYLIGDDKEKALVNAGIIPADQIPLVVQDRTFVPDAAQLADQDPTWDTARWGTEGNFWYHHVYMPAQNPGDPGGMSAYGRWMYGPWFWPPATGTVYGPIPNPYYDARCNLDDPSTWELYGYNTDPFCEPELIPGTPNISAGMEQFNDTPIVNGVAYPTITLEPKAYRLRILNAANDRFFNLQWYVADPNTASTALNWEDKPIGGTEVALDPALLAAAQTDPVVFPTPVDANKPVGPDWIQIGTEGGFLPAPAVIDGQQPTTWITDPTRFDVGNVDKHSLLLAPAERADAIVDFSKVAPGTTLILYNDAPAAFPARVPSYDYYTGAPDQSPNGAPGVLPGFGPNTRTVMQVKIAGTPAGAFDLTALQNAFKHKADGSGVFESSQHPIIVGQAAYNLAYGTGFAASSNCNAPGSTVTKCDGLVRVGDTMSLGFNTLKAPTAKMTMPLEPKAIHDEMNSSTFDEFGRMQANLGVEAQPPTPGAQNVTLYPYVNPTTELIDGTNLPKMALTYDTNGDWTTELKIAPISSATDGTQIWRVTHNGVDTHPIHFHLYDVQLLNRVTWDNIIIAPDANELGWKDTVRISPLEDTIVALRPIVPQVPFELPNSVHRLNPMQQANSTMLFNNFDPQGNPTNPITNQLVNFGWEYVWHCHILSHEEMDMMRPQTLALPPVKASNLASSTTGNGNNRRFAISWKDNSLAETAYVLQRTTNGTTWTDIGTSNSPLNQANTAGGIRSITDTTSNVNTVYRYQVVAKNTVGYGAEFPIMTVQSISDPLVVGSPPTAPSSLGATLQAGPQVSLTWTDNATTETGFIVQRCAGTGCSNFAQIATPGQRNNTGSVTYVDTTVTAGNTYRYRVAAVNAAGSSAFSSTASVTMPAMPAAPSGFTAANGPNGGGNSRSVILNWTDNSSNETGFTIQRATNATFTAGLNTANVGANVRTLTQTGLARNTRYWYRIGANNGTIVSSALVNATPFPITTNR